MVQWNELPVEIQERMLEEQVRQGNEKDPSVFISDITSIREEGGFNWTFSVESYDFWVQIIYYGNFDIFFEKYPKEKFPKWMEVSDDLKNWHKRIVIGYLGHLYLAMLDEITDLPDQNLDSISSDDVVIWNYARDITQPKEDYNPDQVTILKTDNGDFSVLSLKSSSTLIGHYKADNFIEALTQHLEKCNTK